MKAKILGFVIATLIRSIGFTIRWRLDDRSGVTTNNPDAPLIWAFWHNRVFSAPLAYRKFLRKRHGAVLTSPSGDGEIIAQVMSRFGVDSIRGSSNKRPVAAMRELVKWLRTGADIAITPDGPRGPIFELQPGVIKVAQLSGVPILPIRIRYSKAITLKTWDKFQIPLPFCRIDIELGELCRIARDLDESGVEAERVKLERILKGEP